MSSLGDLIAATKDPNNHDIYREQCELELISTFSFQSHHWLCDIAPHILTQDQRGRISLTKQKARERELLEATILLYEKGWPNLMPTFDEAILLANVRRQIAAIIGFEVNYTQPAEVLQR